MDTIESMMNSLIQHGPHSNRIYLMKLHRGDLPEIVDKLDSLAQNKRYTKIFAKISSDMAQLFISAGYREEARIPYFHGGTDDVVFLGKFFSPTRARAENRAELDRILALAQRKSSNSSLDRKWPDGLEVVSCGPGNADEMSAIYRHVFPTYPFPIQDPDYLRDTMRSHIDYYGVRKNERLIALASSEIDKESATVEMTDFATLPSHRGHGLAVWLLLTMEDAMRKRAMHTAYTIARAVSPGMNISFAKSGYVFAGTLINNTNISGCIESMNVWYKPLVRAPSAREKEDGSVEMRSVM